MNSRIDKAFAALADPHRRCAVDLLGMPTAPDGELADVLFAANRRYA